MSARKVIGIEEIGKYLKGEINLTDNKRKLIRHKNKTICQTTNNMGKRKNDVLAKN